MKNDRKALMEESRRTECNVLQLAAMLDMLCMLTGRVVYLHIEGDMTYSLTSSLNRKNEKNVLFAGNFALCRDYICRVIKEERSKNE